MKNNTKILKIFLFVVTIVAISFTSCKKDELEDTNYPNPTPPVSDLGELTCFISEGAWAAKTYTASYLNDMVVIKAVSADNDTIIFNLKFKDGQIYYPFGNAYPDFAILKKHTDISAFYSTKLANINDAVIGHINISVDTTNNILSGSFAFKAYKNTDNSLETITEGKFKNLKYTDPEPIQNTMSAIVEGNSINAFPYVMATKNLNNMFDIRGYADNITLRLEFVETGLSAGDSLSLSDLGYNAYYNKGNGFTISDNGYIKISQYNASTNILKGDFEFNVGTDSIKSGHFNVVYLNQ